MPWSCLALAMEFVCWQKRLKKQANGWKVFRGLALGRIIWRVFLFPLVRKKQTGWLTKHIRTSFAKGIQNEIALKFYKIVPRNLGVSLKVHFVIQKTRYKYKSTTNLKEEMDLEFEKGFAISLSKTEFVKYLWVYLELFVSFHFLFWSFSLFWFLSKKSCQRKHEFVTNMAVFLYD